MKSTSNTWIADKRLFLKLPPILSPDASVITLTSLPAPPWYHWQRPDVLTQQLTILRTNFPITLGGSLLGAVGSWFAMMGLVPTSVMSYWLLSHFMVVLAVFTVIHWLVPWKLKKHHSLSSLAVTLSCCMGAMGLTWGSFAVIAASDGQDVALPFAIAIIGGVSSGAVSLSSSLLWGSISYLFWPVALMIVCCIGLGGQFYYFAAMMLIVYFGLMVMQSRNTEQALCRGIEQADSTAKCNMADSC